MFYYSNKKQFENITHLFLRSVFQNENDQMIKHSLNTDSRVAKMSRIVYFYIDKIKNHGMLLYQGMMGNVKCTKFKMDRKIGGEREGLFSICKKR